MEQWEDIKVNGAEKTSWSVQVEMRSKIKKITSMQQIMLEA